MASGAAQDLLHITRRDYGLTTRGFWWVRIYRTLEGVRHKYCAIFTDRAYGGRSNAFREATAWRDATLLVVPPKRKPHDEVPPGYGYVVLSQIKRRSGELSWVWRVWVRIENRGCRATCYSIEKWGTAAAESKARAWLAEQQRQVAVRLAASTLGGEPLSMC